ncbi:methyltransferase domain-containing protein [Acidiphilium sp. PA]|uniref:class I SAM-dependent methyltransferase n=1 Tax=Acidiphilium sp. PA TaxID=2871705 RepID=UPI002243D7D6|nr:class I SAM-dependent methyltransferase [Acidiphilium sp. PA]MCW8308435.1 methyltransferase domain-containing protein [Acidiphilium sp. PA]
MAPTTVAPWRLQPASGETQHDLQQRRDRAYFAWQLADTEVFWRRLSGAAIDFTGARVLELGCGHGALSVDAAAKGAAQVLGIDLDDQRIAFAQTHAPQAYPNLAQVMAFRCVDIAAIEGEAGFDIVLCKDTFEHIMDLPGVVAEVHRLLRPGGLFVIGTSPLYYSPFGDHGRYLGSGIPWLGAWMPEPLLFRLASVKQRTKIASAADVGLNKMTPARFRALFAPNAWDVRMLRYNAGDKRLLRALSALRRLRSLETLCTVSIYTVLMRR